MNAAMPLEELFPFGAATAAGGTRWEFGDTVRKGGMGVVCEVFETRAPFRHGALKTPRPDRPDAANPFEREITRLKDRVAGKYGPEHYCDGTVYGRRFVIMEWADPLATGLGAEEALPLVDGVTEGLSILHANNLCHGDVKFLNLGQANKTPKILDLGSLRRIVPDGQAEVITHTPGLSAPELAANGCAAPWIDVYGFACALNEILGDEALEIYSPAIRMGMDLRTGKRLGTAKELREAVHACHKAYRQRKLRTMTIRATTHLLVAGVAVGVTVIVSANRKERLNVEAAKSMQCETATLTELKLGKLAFQASNTVEAIESFRRAKAYGESAARILRLIEKASK